jgi:hypothetical protein
MIAGRDEDVRVSAAGTRPAGASLMARLRRSGVLLQAARGPVPNVAELVAGEPIRGSWWSHPRSHEIFDAINRLRSSPAVVATRLIDGKVTLIHRRLWPAVVRLADRFPPAALDAIHEEHTPSGAHRTSVTPFPDWVPAGALEAGAELGEMEAMRMLPECVRRLAGGA